MVSSYAAFRIASVISVLVITIGLASAYGIELRGEVYDGINCPNVVGRSDPLGNPVNLSWSAVNFAGFGEDMKFGINGSEMLLISCPLSDINRYIPKQRLWYISDRVLRNFTVYDQKGLYVSGSANYSMFTFLGTRNIAIKPNSSKLAPLVLEQNISEIKALSNGSVWDMGECYTLTAQEITNTSARLVLSRNGVEMDNKTATINTAYVSLQNIANETNVPIFVTYIDSIFVGNETCVVFLKYTWLISISVGEELKAGDIEPVHKVFEVYSIDSNRITLANQVALMLSKDAAITLLGYPSPSTEGFKLKVADSDVLRFYPFIEITTPGIYEVRGKISESGSTRRWDARNFAGLWYDLSGNLISELLDIAPSEPLTIADRIIDTDNLNYSTTRQLRQYVVNNVNSYLTVEKALDSTGTKTAFGTHYAILGWQGKQYVAVNGKANKLAKVVLEHLSRVSDKKTLTVGETWDMGDGYTLTAQSIDAKASPRQVWLVLSKDGVKLDDRVAAQGQVYTYVASSLAGESDVPIFVTYVDSIFAGATTDMVQVRYTWLISSNVIEIRADDVFGAMKVIESTDSHVKLKNVDTSITLSAGSVVDIMGNLKFRVADKASVLRFYPKVDYEIADGTPISTAIVSISNTIASPDSNVTRAIMVENVNNLAAGTINLTYNPNVVNVLSVSSGDFGAVTSNIDNTKGTVIITAYSNTGRSGNVVFANLLLKAVGQINASSPLTLSVQALTDSNGNSINYTISSGMFTIAAVMKGDVNNDNQITVVDALFVSQYSVGLRTLTSLQLSAADVNNDGQVTIVDALFIAQYTVGLRQL